MKRQTVLMLLVVVLGVAGLALVAGGMSGTDCGTPETGACCQRIKHGAPKGEVSCRCDVGVPCPPTGKMQAECCLNGCSNGVCQ